ncbi:MAG: hypothetical protein JWP89_3741 [Schlesneria sp.]|nr:hypothetical protein [Schlesneria sp.]
MSYRYRIKSIIESFQTETETVLSGELLEGEIPEGIHVSHVQFGDRRIALQVKRAVILVNYKPNVSPEQKSTFISVVDPSFDCALLKHLILANDDLYVPKPERKCTPAELEQSFEEGRQYLAEALKDFKIPD